MELLEQELNDPSSPRPPPLPPRQVLIRDTLPSIHSASTPSIMTHTGSTMMTSRSPINQSSDRDIATTHEERSEPRYVSSPQVSRPHTSAALVASQLRASARCRGMDRSRTCDESSTSDTVPALPPPRKFSLPLDSLGRPEATRSRSPGQQSQQQSGRRQHRDSPDTPSTPTASSPRSSPHRRRL